MNSTLADTKYQDVYKSIMEWRSDGIYPYLPTVEGYEGNFAQINKNKLLMFGSCDYLGLSQNNEIKEQAIEAIKEFGTNTLGAQVFCGYTTIHQELEGRLSALFGKEAILFPSGMSANIGLISNMASSDDVIINDRCNHVSIFMGTTLSGAHQRSFSHNNIRKLEQILARSQDKGKRIIIVDGLFSADGDIAPLDEITTLAKEYNAYTIVDEAHSFGVYGPNGKGVADYFNVIDKVDAIVGTMSKAVGSVGGFVVANPEIVDSLRHFAPSYTSSRGSVPAVAAATLASLKLMEREGENLREKLWNNANFTIKKLREKNINVLDTQSPIVPVLIGSNDKTIRVFNWLKENGLFTAAMISPSIPEGKARLRLGVTSLHTEEELVIAVDLICKARDIYEF